MAAGIIATGLLLLLLLAVAGWRWGGGDWDRHFTVAESFLAIAGLLGAGAWYFVARPDASKLKLDQSVVAHSAGPKRVLLLVELSLTNVGGRSLDLTRQPYKIFVQQVTPISGLVESEFQEGNSVTQNRELKSADTWTYLAKTETTLSSQIESGETENVYYRTILPCDDDLSIYATSWVYKPQTNLDRIKKKPQLAWIKQTYVDLSKECQSNVDKGKK